MSKGEQMKVRLPADLKAFVAGQAERYGNSQNAEIVRAVRERMDRTNKLGLDGAGTPTKPQPHEAAERR